MNRHRPGRCLRLLVLALTLIWPLSAIGHGPGGHGPEGHEPEGHGAMPPSSHQEAPAANQAPDQEAHSGHSMLPPPEPASAPVAPDEWLQEKTGDILPLDAVFTNQRAERVTLRELIDRPTLLLPVYYRCPTSCSFDLANLADAVRRSSHPAGSFRVISVSFDSEETPAMAAAAKPNFTQLLAKDFPEDGWVFLTGDRANINRLTRAIGYRFKKKDAFTFIHPSALAVIDKDGRIIKYVYGSFTSGDVDLALAEAARGTPATSIRRLLAFCLPANPRQMAEVFLYFRIGAVTLLVIGGLFFFRFLRRKHSDQSQPDKNP